MSMTANEGRQPTFEGWAILELFGHRRLAGYVQEVEMFGTKMCRIDVPKSGEQEGSRVWAATQFYGGGAVYCTTPTTESMARRTAALTQPEPVARWELPADTAPAESTAEAEVGEEVPFGGEPRTID